MQVATIYENIGNMSDDETLCETVAHEYKEILETMIANHFAEQGWTATVELRNYVGCVESPKLMFDSAEDENEFLSVLESLKEEAYQEALKSA